MTATATRKADRAEAIESLRAYLEPGDTLYTVLRHVSASGMSRVIQPVTIETDDRTGPWVAHLGYNVARAIGERYDRDREGIRVSGAGMDMGFWLAYEVGRTLWPEGFECTGDRCPSNDHSNGYPYPHPFPSADTAQACSVYGCSSPAADHPTAPRLHRDGGYALVQRWI